MDRAYPFNRCFGVYANAAPAAGNHIFQAYLKPVDSCDLCHAEFRDIRTDDIAPYFTILIVGTSSHRFCLF